MLYQDSTLDNEENCDELSIPKTGNSNKIPKISDISILDQRIAKNVTELRKENWCSIHNRHCLKDREPHVEISNMMFSTWATEMVTFEIYNYTLILKLTCNFIKKSYSLMVLQHLKNHQHIPYLHIQEIDLNLGLHKFLMICKIQQEFFLNFLNHYLRLICHNYHHLLQHLIILQHFKYL